jgi:hypothetical protein
MRESETEADGTGRGSGQDNVQEEREVASVGQAEEDGGWSDKIFRKSLCLFLESRHCILLTKLCLVGVLCVFTVCVSLFVSCTFRCVKRTIEASVIN